MKFAQVLGSLLRMSQPGAAKRLCDNAHWIRNNPGCWTEVVPQQKYKRRPPVMFGEVAVNFAELYPPSMPAMGLISIERGQVIGPHGWLVTPDGSLLYENSWYGSDFQAKAWPVKSAQRKRVKGSCLSLASDFAAGNYGHYVLDCLARAGIFLKSGRTFADVDYVYIAEPPSQSAQVLLRMIGIAPEQCLWAQQATIETDLLLGTTFPGTKRNYPAWMTTFFRDLLGPELPSPHRRIYVPRSGVRKLINESEFRPVLERFGFEIYDFKTVKDEARYFAEAAIVVGAHGAGLTNLVFCSPETKVLELIPSDHVWPYYYTITESAGAQYAYIVGQSLGSRPKGAWGPSPFDFEVDLTTFETAIATLCQNK